MITDCRCQVLHRTKLFRLVGKPIVWVCYVCNTRYDVTISKHE